MPVRSRDRVRALLAAAADGLDAHEVAAALDVHVTTARFHLNNLVEAGDAVGETVAPEGVGRPRMLYRVSPAPPADELLHLLLGRLGDTETERERCAADVGRAWARAHVRPAPSRVAAPDPVTVVETALTALGFQVTDAVSAFGEHRISLCSCPLQSIAVRHPEIAHGVVRGAVAAVLEHASPILRSAYVVDVTPDPGGDCALTLSLTGAPSRPGTSSTHIDR